MSDSDGKSEWLSIALALAIISASSVVCVYFWIRKRTDVNGRVKELEISLKSSLEKCVSERKGRIRAQQALRKALAQPKLGNTELTSYPMAPIATIRSCFSTRNGTPRQPSLVPLSRARLLFDPARVAPASLEGLEEYSHCWIIYVFHLNTDLEKLWKNPSESKFKAKVRVPKLNGAKMGVFATRSPHRPCPIGLTVAKVEAVQGHMVLVSGVDLVDGTPILDIKPYLPYSDSIKGARIPSWVKEGNMLAVVSLNFSMGFSIDLADCWTKLAKKSLYASPDEVQSLIKQVLSWDIRSVSQRRRPHNPAVKIDNGDNRVETVDSVDYLDDAGFSLSSSRDILYHLILEGLDVVYRMDSDGHVLVEKVILSSHIKDSCTNTVSST